MANQEQEPDKNEISAEAGEILKDLFGQMGQA
jgi:hypothetical protein